MLSFCSFIAGSAAAALLALGFSDAAGKLDPVSQKTVNASSMQTGEASALPCIDADLRSSM